MNRIRLCILCLSLGLCAPATVFAGQNDPFDVSTLAMPVLTSKAGFVDYMSKLSGQDKKMLALRFDRLLALRNNKDVYTEKEEKAFLLTARESFTLDRNLPRAYDHAFLDIGYGVTISGPHLVMRMTSALDVQPADKVLEVGTGSGYQSAILAHLSNHVYSVEIIEPLHERTKKLYGKLVEAGNAEYRNVHLKSGDGYHGWEESGPFNKIIVTCAIDHIPPPLLKQLAPNGVMVIPVGPPGKQTLLKVQKTVDAEGKTTITRKDVYNGKKSVSFVPFTKEGGGTWSGRGIR
ncbi:MAG: protein-L-isoaspartate O-methyltransferase [Magnetococcus sp. DMHC-8]